MKKITILLSILLWVFATQAQNTWKGGELNYNSQEMVLKPAQAELFNIQNRLKAQAAGDFKVDVSKATDCSVDTSLFPLLKAPQLGLEGFINSVNNFSSSLQRYILGTNETATVNGFDFHGYFFFDSTNATVISQDVTCNILGVAADGSPDRGNVLSTVQVTVDTAGTNRADGRLSLFETRYSATFATPVTVSEAFFLEVSNPSTTELIVLFRSSIDVNGAGGGGNDAGDGWYRLVRPQPDGPIDAPGPSITGTSGGAPAAWDADNLLHPYIEFTIEGDFELTQGDCLAHGEAAIFENTSSSLSGNRYFNVFAGLTSINSQPDSSWRWIADTAAQTPVVNWGTEDLVTVYNAPTTQAVVALQVIELGYSRLCQDIIFKAFDSGPLTSSSFTFEVDTNQTVVFTNNSTGTDFMWDFGDGNTSTEVIPTHTYATGGNYTVTLTASGTGFCPATSTQQVDVATTGIMDDLLNSQVNIYPNPSSGLFTLDLNMDQAEEVSIEVRNMIGQQVFELKPGFIQSGEIQIDMQGRQNGIYLLTLRANDRQITRKLSLK